MTDTATPGSVGAGLDMLGKLSFFSDTDYFIQRTGLNSARRKVYNLHLLQKGLWLAKCC